MLPATPPQASAYTDAMARFSHDVRIPNENAEYRAAREVLLQEEAKLREQCERVAAMRRTLPSGGAPTVDYEFHELTGGTTKPVRLSQLFAEGKDTLIAYNFMYGPDQERPCPMCTSFLDGVDAQARHITQRAGLVVIARSPAERLDGWRIERGWKHLRLVSSAANTYNLDYHAEDEEGRQLPMLHVWRKIEGRVRHFWASELLHLPRDGDPRHLDLLWPLWQFLDLAPEGRGDFYPALSY